MARRVATLVVLASLAGCAVARTVEEHIASTAPTPGSATLRSLAGERECRLLVPPAVLPDIATLVDTGVLQRAFPRDGELSFGLTFNRLGHLEEARHLGAASLRMDDRRETLDRLYPAIRPQQPGEEWSVRIVRDADAGEWTIARSVFCPAQFVPRELTAGWSRYDEWLRGEVHVTVAADGTVDAAYMPQVSSREDDQRNRRIASGLRFVPATLNGETVHSVVIFGWRR